MGRPVLKKWLACVSAVLLSVPGNSARGARPVTARADIDGCDGNAISGHASPLERPSSEGVWQVCVILLAEDHAVHIHETAACGVINADRTER